MNQTLLLVLALVAKLTLVILLGTAIAALLRTRSAATRHFIWALTLFSTLTIGIAAFIAPPVTLPIPYTVKQPPAITAVAPAPTPSPIPQTPNPNPPVTHNQPPST